MTDEGSGEAVAFRDDEPMGGSHTAACPPPATRRREPVARSVIVERIETVTMTPEQRQAAVDALAELIVRWELAGAPNTRPQGHGVG